MIRAALFAHHWHHALVAAVAMGLLGLAGRDRELVLPLVSGSIPAPLASMVLVILVVCTPLQDSFPRIVDTLAREPLARALRPVMATCLAALAYLPASGGAHHGAHDPASSGWARLVLLVALAIATTVVIGEHSWMVVASVGVLALIVDGSNPDRPVSRLLGDVGPAWTGVALVAAAAAYAVRGPRSSS